MAINFVEGRKAGSGLPLELTALRQANFQQLQAHGFQELVRQRLAQELAVVDDQHFIVWSGTGIVSPIEFLLGFFPSEGHQPYTTLDTFSDGALWALRTALLTITQSVPLIESKTLTQKSSSSDVIICQHIGPEEGDYADHHLQSFTQFHLHVFSNMSEGSTLTDASKPLRNGLREPLVAIMADVVTHLGVNIRIEKDTGCLVIADHTPNLSIDHLRFLPKMNSLRLENFSQKYQLSPHSIRLLSFLQKHLQPASEENAPWSWLSKGVYGSLSIVYHTQENSWSIRLIPRTRVTDYRTLAVTENTTQVFDKNRSKKYLPDEETSFINNQIEAMSSLKQLFDEISALVILSVIMSGPEPTVERYPGRGR